MHSCALCGGEAAKDKFFSRKSVCPHCGGDLHICLNCRFHAPGKHNDCIEPRAEFQRIRDKANFCDYFSFRTGEPAAKKGGGAPEDAKRKFEDLFKK